MTDQEVLIRNIIDGVILDLSLCIFIMGFIALIIYFIYFISSKIFSMIKRRRKRRMDWKAVYKYAELAKKSEDMLIELSEKAADNIIERRETKEKRKYWSIYG